MLVVMQTDATQTDIDRVCDAIREMGYQAVPMPGGQRTAIGLVGNDGRVDDSQISALPGVAQVIPIGGEVRQYRIAPNPPALRSLGVTYEQVEQALTQFGVNTGGGFTDQHAREYLIRNIGRTTNLDDLRSVVVAQVNGGPVFLRQVASVEFAPKVKRGEGGYMGKPAVIVSVEKQPNVDTIALTREIERALKEITASLPQGIKADQVVFRQADFIETSIRNVQQVLIEAGIVVAVVLFAFLLNWRTTAISLTAIPVSILATATIFYVAGLSINTMTLGGLAIALGDNSAGHHDSELHRDTQAGHVLIGHQEIGLPDLKFALIAEADGGAVMTGRYTFEIEPVAGPDRRLGGVGRLVAGGPTGSQEDVVAAPHNAGRIRYRSVDAHRAGTTHDVIASKAGEVLHEGRT